MTDHTLHIHNMPPSRPADYCFGFLDDSVFADFNHFEKDKIRLIRISFDSYGCCNLGDSSIPLSAEDSAIFKDLLKADLIDKDQLMAIIKKAIALNKDLIWPDALKEYELI